MQIALITFFTANRKVTEGDVVGDDDPVLAGREHLFVPGEGSVSPVVAYSTHVRPLDGTPADADPDEGEAPVFLPVDGVEPSPAVEPAAAKKTAAKKTAAKKTAAKKTAAKKTAAKKTAAKMTAAKKTAPAD